jgi:glutathione S-transferase
VAKKLVLYSFVPFDRSARVRWLAHELGIEVDERKLDFAGGEHRTEAHLARHPFGLVPAVEIDGETQWESVAICQSLAEQQPEAGLTVPMASPLRRQYLSWLLFAASTFDAAAFNVFEPCAIKPDEGRATHGKAVLFPLLVQLARHLHTRDYLLGERFMLPDLILGYSINLLYLVKVLEDYPVLKEYRRRLAERPAAKASRVFTPRPG